MTKAEFEQLKKLADEQKRANDLYEKATTGQPSFRDLAFLAALQAILATGNTSYQSDAYVKIVVKDSWRYAIEAENQRPKGE